jgi:hypothetical protein
VPNTQTLTHSLLEGSEQEILDRAVTARQPDSDVPGEELAWWLALQERLETRAELAAAGLL